MTAILALLMAGSLISILIGLIRPAAVIRWGAPEKRGRGKVILYYGLAVVVSAILIGVLSPESDKVQPLEAQARQGKEPESEHRNVSQSTHPNTDKTGSTTKDQTQTKSKKEKEESQAKEENEKLKHPEWNVNEPDAMKNGNIPKAIDMLKVMKETPAGEPVSPNEVMKAPWNFYGKPLIFTGEVAVVEDYPPGSDFGKAGFSSDIVIETGDGTIVEFFSMVPSGNIKAGETVSITAFVVGRTEVENKLGGSFTHLIAVTNRLDAAGNDRP